MERAIDAEYLRLLDSYYQEWMAGFDLCPVLSIRTDDLDFVHKAQHLEIVIDRIRDKLLGREEIEFPAE
jgi:deoxyadenosine/deoxycytidine kinase